MNMKNIVISGINLFEGGTLSIYKDCLDNIIEYGLNETCNITAFVHRKDLFTDYEDKLTLIELPRSRKNYLLRLWYEYIYFYFYSRGKNIDIWLSIHDTTPNVNAKRRYVYCHNPTPFMKTELKNLKYSYKVFLFSLFYKYLYKINIKKNTAVIVQQDWIRQEFIKMYNLKDVIVARPTVNIENVNHKDIKLIQKTKFQFIYPSYPRFFKNFEVICEACKILDDKSTVEFEVLLTVDGSENRYSSDLYRKYGNMKNIRFIGLQNRMDLFNLYKNVDCIVFPSKLETWGLPISEFKQTGKPMLVSDLPYAHETVGIYDKVVFFNSNNYKELADIMENAINRKLNYQVVEEAKVEEPYAEDWKTLLDMINI